MKKAVLATPVYFLVSVAYWLVFWECGQPMSWAAFGVGVLGWWIAYVRRIPISLVLMKGNPEKKPKGIVYFSGPLEEGMRLIALVVIGSSAGRAVSVGQGWAFIEVLFAVVQLFALAKLKDRNDEKALQAKAMLAQEGVKLDGSPLWGALERVFASAFHIGSTLVIAWNPWLVLVMIPLHTMLNVTVVRWTKRAIAVRELPVVGLGTVVFVAGLFLMFGL